MIDVKIIKKKKERSAGLISGGITTPGNAGVTPGLISEAVHAARADVADYATRAASADVADYAARAKDADHAQSAHTLDDDSPVRDEFLSKVKPDTAAELIDFVKGLHVGNFEAGASGGCFHMDDDGHSYAELDKLYVRVKAFFEELTIIKKGVLAGDQYITPGGGIKCAKVEKTDTTYRCYFLSGQDGELTDCAFVAGDQAIARMFNARTGTANKVSNHSYWRLVTEVVNDAFADESGNHYGYIALSKNDCEAGSDAPQPGDEICQFGNRTDSDRQCALLFSTTAADAPCVKLYSGINSYSLEGKAVVSFGRDTQTDKIFFRLGASGASQFLEYSQDGGLTVAGKISSQSTLEDGRTLENALQGNGYSPNLIKGANNVLDSTSYGLGDYRWDARPEAGTKCTITICGKVGATDESIGVYQNGGYNTIGHFYSKTETIQSFEFTVIDNAATPSTSIAFFHAPNDGNFDAGSYIKWAVVTVGSNSATAWIPSASEMTAQNLMSRYSSDAASWHTLYQSGDVWMQTSNDGGSTWSAAVRIQGASYSPNLLKDTESLTVTAGSDSSVASNNFAFRSYYFDSPLEVKVGDHLTLSVENIEVLSGNPTQFTFYLYNDDSTSYAPIATLTKAKPYITFSVTKAVTARRLIAYAGTSGVTAGNSVRYDKVMLVKGDTPAPWTPAASEMIGKDGQYPKFQWAVGSTSAVTGVWQDTPMTALPGQYVWMRSGVVVPPSTTPATWGTAIRLTGDTGQSYTLDLSNEMMPMACDSAGNVVSSYRTSQASVFKGTTKVTSGITYTIAQATGVSATITPAGLVTPSGLTADTATIVVHAVVDGVTLQTTLSLYKVKPGVNGSSFMTLTSPTSNTNFYPCSETLSLWKEWTTRESAGWLCGNFDEINVGDTVCANGIISDMNNTPCQLIGVVSRKATAQSSVYIDKGAQLIYGQPGTDGSSFTQNLLLDKYAKASSNTSVIEHGIEIAANTYQDTYFYIYTDGTLTVSPGDVFTFSCDVEGLDSNGTWSFIVFNSANSGCKITLKNGRCHATFTATASYTGTVILPDDQTRVSNSKPIRITNAKLERGANENPVWTPAASEMVGQDAVVYELELSANNITRDAIGNLSATSITVQKYKTTGNSARVLTTEKTIRYQRIGVDSTTTTLSGASSHSIPIPDNDNLTAIIVELLDGTTVLDRERIPVIEEGTKLGDNLVKNSEFNKTGTTYSLAKVYTTESLVVGDTYTFTIWGQLGSGRTWWFYDNLGGVYICTPTKIGTYAGGEIYSAVATLPSGMADRAKHIFTIYQAPRTATSASVIHRVKIEKGTNKAPVWTASPYDMDYIKAALQESGSIEGGLVLASLMRLGYTQSNGEYVTMAGMNGIYNGNDKGGGLMLWGGGDMIDPEGTNSGTPATSGIRMDGTAFFCNNVIRLEKNRIMVGDVVQLASDGLTLIDGSNNALRIGNVSVPDLMTAASSSGSLSQGSFSSGTINVYPDGNLYVASNTSINKTALNGNAVLPAGAVVTIEGTINVPQMPGVPLNYFGASVVVEFYLDNTLLQSAHLNLQAGNSVWSTPYNTTLRLPNSGKLYGVLRFDYPISTNSTAIDGSPFEGATFVMTTRSWQYTTSNQNTLGKDGFLAAWGQSLLYCGADGVEMRFNNTRLRLDSNGIRKSTNNGSSWSNL